MKSNVSFSLTLGEGPAFDVVRFELTEGISESFRLELDLSSADGAIDATELLDRDAVFTIQRDGLPERTVVGMWRFPAEYVLDRRRTRQRFAVGGHAFLSIKHVVAIAISLVMPVGCQAWTWSPEERTSHEAYEKGFAACDKLKDFMDRKHCFNDLPEDLTQIDPDEIVGVSLTGIDHLADHLSVQDFYVDGTPGAQAGTGGSLLCCAKLPRVWRPGLTVEVRWFVQNWRDCIYEEHVRRVPVERYEQIGRMGVHFIANGNVRVVSSNWYPSSHPDSGHPVKDPIPDKHPWSTYSYEACTGKWIERKSPSAEKE